MPGGRKPKRGLEAYRRKRAAERTPEPFGGGAPRPHLFVVQKHAARRLHHDFRLEWRGVLLSWAVPRGPSLDPQVKRLAVHVEDHPVDYADFEGVIPEGNYGAGAVILWDRGRWIPREDPDTGLRDGKLLFDLEGYKLRGRWTLVRTRGAGKSDTEEWLLIKKPDAHAVPGAGDDALPDGSVLSGLSVDELRDGCPRVADRVERARRAGAPRRRIAPGAVRPMLAEPRATPFSRPGWIFEVKYDGYRGIAAKEDGAGRLRTRNGRDVTRSYPEIARAVAALPHESVILDGELVVLDPSGHPSFESLQRRAALTRRLEVERASVELPVTYFAFDLLALDDLDLRPLPLAVRKALLEDLLPEAGPLRRAVHFADGGELVFAEVERLGLEGVVAKRADSPYRAGRSPLWQKIRIRRADDFVVVGFTEPRGSRAGIGALHLAGFEAGQLRYAGRVGSGLDTRELAGLGEALARIERSDPPCAGPVPRTRGHRWVEPLRVCEVRYAEVTRDGLLRQPVFLRMRDDKRPDECQLPAREAAPDAATAPDGPPRTGDRGEPEVPFTNLDKVFWPGEGITKGDLVEYHRAIAPWLLPYLVERPLVLTRYPDGIAGKSFFQKDAPEWVPDWVRTERMWSEDAGREIHYFVCDDLASLLYVVNLGTIPLHVWSSRVSSLPRPDWCILDLDPKGAPFRNVVRVARAIHELCEELGLPSFAKTSGSTGLHVLVPLGRQISFEACRTLAELLARITVGRLPDLATIERRVRAREGRVYVDHLQNGHGRLLVAPFSVRPLPGAPVSMPLRWSEVDGRLRIDRFTLGNAVARMRRLGEDPMRQVLTTSPDLDRALERLRGASG